MLFTLSSLMCGMAWDIQSMIVFRAIQGFVGGAMVPTVFATGFAMFERQAAGDDPGDPRHGLDAGADAWAHGRRLDHRRDRAGAGCSSSTSCPGVVIAIALPLLGKVDEPNLAMLKRIDWLHVVSLAVFLGALQYVLEEGPRHQWFDDPTVATGGLDLVRRRAGVLRALVLLADAGR